LLVSTSPVDVRTIPVPAASSLATPRVVFTSTRPASTRKAIAGASEGPPDADERDPDEPDPNGKVPEPNGEVPEPNGEVPEPNGNVPEPNGKFGEPEEGEFADGSEVDVELDCQAT
jgi:hypothetical protein